MSNSSLVTYTNRSPNCTKPRNHVIDTITIHCVVGQFTAKQICNLSNFTKYNPKGASCNYAVGKDGSIGLCVDEENRSWCTSNRSNDHRAITIETASDTSEPFAVTDTAYNALLELVTDICKRNGKKKLLWFADKTKTFAYNPKPYEMLLTVHRWFEKKSCPGNYLYSRHGEIAEEVTRRLSQDEGDDNMDISKWTDADIKNLATRLQDVLAKQTVGPSLAPELESAKAKGITDGSRPGAWATRAEVAAMISRTTK